MKRLVFFLAGIVLITAACNKNPVEPGPKTVHLSQKSLKLLDESNDFAFDLFQDIATHDTSKNQMISPLSISFALGMTYNGADSTTKTAMAQTMHLDGMSDDDINLSFKELADKLLNVDPKVIMEIANSIWYKNVYQVEQDFLDINKKYYYAEVNPLDFSDPHSVGIINNWVKEKTHDKIDKIIDKINPADVMFLINAIYFKGTWKYQFNKEETEEQPFYNEQGEVLEQVNMMGMKSTIRYYSDNKMQAIDLPYGQGNYCMSILLPAGSSSLAGLITSLTTGKWEEIINDFADANVNVFLPKFKIKFKSNLNKTLIRLGMGIAFDPSMANFHRIIPDKDLYISSVDHKTFIQTDEEGTEAAAVTCVTITNSTTTIGTPQVITFRADHPFLFIIHEQTTGAILFMGKITQP